MEWKPYYICIIIVLVGMVVLVAVMPMPKWNILQSKSAESQQQELIKYQCQDGSLRDSFSDCPKIMTQQADEERNCIELLQYNDRRNEYGWLIISGTVKNKCSYRKTGTIRFLLYDSSKNLITSDYTHSDPWQIPAGATRGFEKTWTDDTVYTKVSSYKIFVDSD